MSLPVFAVVLVAAALHATWNAIVRLGRDRLLTTILVAVFGALVGAVCLPFLPPVSSAAWPYLGISAVFEVIYYVMLGLTYARAEMSGVYPLMRGTPPLIVTVVSTAAFGVMLAPLAWGGILLISAGIMSQVLLGRRGVDPRGIGYALANALVIAAYTLTDGFGVRVSGEPAAYAMWTYVLTGLPLGLWALVARPDIVTYARGAWPLGLVGGIGTLAAYGLVLWAMTEAPVPLVAALRETAILFGIAIAGLVLKEKIGAARIVAALIIVAGVVLVRLR